MSPFMKSLLLCCAVSSLPACGMDAEAETESQQAASLSQNLSPNGNSGEVQQPPRALPLAANATACFQLNNGASATWFINASLDINAYPYTVVGGSISGTICDSPNWRLTGGSVGGSITVNGTHTGAVACAGTVSIVAPFGPPAGYAGTYGFDGSNNSFSHRTLFLGFNRACP